MKKAKAEINGGVKSIIVGTVSAPLLEVYLLEPKNRFRTKGNQLRWKTKEQIITKRTWELQRDDDPFYEEIYSSLVSEKVWKFYYPFYSPSCSGIVTQFIYLAGYIAFMKRMEGDLPRISQCTYYLYTYTEMPRMIASCHCSKPKALH